MTPGNNRRHPTGGEGRQTPGFPSGRKDLFPPRRAQIPRAEEWGHPHTGPASVSWGTLGPISSPADEAKAQATPVVPHPAPATPSLLTATSCTALRAAGPLRPPPAVVWIQCTTAPAPILLELGPPVWWWWWR